ncbi:hypothetical protein WJU23_05180 [Prosthecobacter sp. SYSU 5D2]|uniref:hypothetical protein n=1 Tax=Prosthecobacter sp. SYSU 5D2 TaxID=3134134 RepID=UPI0031FF0DC2
MKLLVVMAGCFLGGIVAFAAVDLLGIRMDPTLNSHGDVIAGDRYYLVPLAGLVGAVIAAALWSQRQSRLDAKLPWNQKRQGGPILPGASPEFMEQVNERTGSQ